MLCYTDYIYVFLLYQYVACVYKLFIYVYMYIYIYIYFTTCTYTCKHIVNHWVGGPWFMIMMVNDGERTLDKKYCPKLELGDIILLS